MGNVGFDGLVVAGGSPYLAGMDGKILCFREGT